MAKLTAKPYAKEVEAVRSILDSMDTCVYVTDIDTSEILFMNRKMSDLFGGGDFTGQICWKVLQNGFSDECSFCPRKVLRKNPKETVVWEEHNTVTKKYYKNTDSLIKWPNGKMVHIQNSLDITDLKETQQTLHRQVAQQELLTDIAINFASNTDLDTSMNGAIAKLGVYLNADKIAVVNIDPVTDTATTAADWASEPAFLTKDRVVSRKTLDPDDFVDRKMRAGKLFVLSDPDVPRSLHKVFSEHFGVKDLFNIPIFSGKRYWGFMAIQQRRETSVWSSASMLLAQAVCSTISLGIERKQAEQKLFKAQRELREVVDTVPMCIYWKDAALTFTGCNIQFADYFNVLPGDILNRRDYPGNEGICRSLAAFDAAALATGKALLNHEVEDVNPGNVKRWFSVSIVPVADSEGGITSLLGMFQDITDKKHGELEMIERDKELERVLKIAEKSDKAKSEFLSRMSHEIRTPMNAIIGMTKIASASGDIVKIKSCLNKVDAASGQLLSIINDILDMSKIEAGKIELSKQPFRLCEALENVCSIISVKSDEKRQSLHLDVAPDIPKILIGDETRLAQVLTNLLSNAVKFTPDGGTVRLSARLLGLNGAEADIGFTVEDNGIGISKEQQSRLFMAFEQGDGSISRKFGGTGLGLSISKNLVSLMGGAIRAESEPGKGSRFFFNIRAGVGQGNDVTPGRKIGDVKKGGGASIGAADTTQENAEKIIAAPDFAGKRVLIAEDVEINRDIAGALLEPTRIGVDYAENGRQAVAMYSAAPDSYSLIFMDIHMPEMDGYEATRNIRGLPFPNAKTVPIVAMTANVFREDIDRCMAAGMNGHIGKPVDDKKLYDTLNKYLKPREINTMDNAQSPKAADYSAYLPYIDAAGGLNRIRGNKKLYAMMLKSFKGNPLFPDAKAAVVSGDLKAAQMHMHTLKGVAGNLSLKALYELIVPVEAVLKTAMVNAREMEPVEDAFNKTMTAIDSMLEALRSEGVL